MSLREKFGNWLVGHPESPDEDLLVILANNAQSSTVSLVPGYNELQSGRRSELAVSIRETARKRLARPLGAIAHDHASEADVTPEGA